MRSPTACRASSWPGRRSGCAPAGSTGSRLSRSATAKARTAKTGVSSWPGGGPVNPCRVQPDEPGELEAEMQGQPVAPAPQVDPGYSFGLLQPVVQRAAVQAEPLGARLRIASEVEVGLQGRDHRAVGLVEQGDQARVEAGRCLGVRWQL